MSLFFDFHTHIRHLSPQEAAIFSLFPDEDLPLESEMKGKFFLSLGIHPRKLSSDKRLNDALWQKFLEKIKSAPFVAGGECGLDKFSSAPLRFQMEIFEKHIELAEKTRKNLVIHCVKHYGELCSAKKNAANTKSAWIIHGFKGGHSLANQLIEKGFLLSFGPGFSRSQKHSDSFIFASSYPFFLETDSSGTKIQDVYREAAGLLKIGIDELSEKILNNTKYLVLPKL
jgi:TatD DNase family protein